MAENIIKTSLVGVDRSLGKTLRGAGKDALTLAQKLDVMGRKMQAAGATMTRKLTLPILAGSAVAVKLSMNFEKAFTNIEALVGASSKEIDEMREHVLSLAGETARAPQELADALYFIESSGLKGATALDALDASAMAAAAGLGDTATVADAVTSAMNAYGSEVLPASKATDILLAAIREGKSEPAEFAKSIGGVIPVAQAMGVSFGEVAGTMAALSLSGTNADEAVTQITAALSQSIKPTKQGSEALASLGMSYADLREEIADTSLIETFNTLKDKFHGNVEETAKVFGNIRALRGVMTLTGVSSQKYAGIIERVGNAQGDTNKAFEVAAGKDGFKMQQAWVDLQASAIQAGDVILPIAADLAKSLGRIMDAFSRLSGGHKKFIVYTGLMVAAVGPLLSLTGGILRFAGVWAKVSRAIAGAGAASATATPKIAAAGTAASTATSMVAGFFAAFAPAAIAAGGVYALTAGVKAFNDDMTDQGSKTFATMPKITAALKNIVPSDSIKSMADADKQLRNIAAATDLVNASIASGGISKQAGAPILKNLAEMKAAAIDFGTESHKVMHEFSRNADEEGLRAASSLREDIDMAARNIAADFAAWQASGALTLKVKAEPDVISLQNARTYFQSFLAGNPVTVNVNGTPTTMPYFSRPRYTNVKPHSGGTFTGPHSGYPAIMHGTETVVSHDHPGRGMRDLAKAGLVGAGGGGLTINILGDIVGVDVDDLTRQIAAKIGLEQRRLNRGMA